MVAYRYFVGVDWGSATHVSTVVDPEGERVAERSVEHRGAAIGEWLEWLASFDAPEQIAVAIEVPRGPVVEALLERGFQVYAVNPKQLDRFRDRHTVAGAKDDRRDSFVLADSLRTDRRLYRRVAPDDPIVIELRESSRLHDELTEELGRLANRLREQLWRYYPQALDLCPAANEPWFWTVLEEAPSPAKAHQFTARRASKLLKGHRIRRVQPAEVVSTLRERPLQVSDGTIRAASGHVMLLLPRLRLIHDQLKATDKRITELLDELAKPRKDSGPNASPSDVAIALSMTGIGQIVCASLFSEAAPLLAARDLNTLRAVTGAAPVTKQSGKRRYVVMRRACHPRLRDAIWHWARVYAQRDPAGSAYYARLRARGHSHARTLRGLGDRLLEILVAMLRDGTLYNPDRRQPATKHP